jgi:hypothetical protein
MNRTTKTVLIGGGLLWAAWYVWKTYVLGTGLQFVPLGVSLGGSNGLIVQIGVQNPTSSPIVLNSFAGSVTVNGTPVANVSNFQGLTIAANAQTALNFDVSPNWLGLGLQGADIIQHGFTGMVIQLKGTANINGSAIPETITF